MSFFYNGQLRPPADHRQVGPGLTVNVNDIEPIRQAEPDLPAGDTSGGKDGDKIGHQAACNQIDEESPSRSAE
jgi:hypothetical protein